MTPDEVHENDCNCGLCDVLDALETAALSYLKAVGCMCPAVVGVSFLDDGVCDIREIHASYCPRAQFEATHN